MAEGLTVNANLNKSSFESGLRDIERSVSNFGRRAPRMLGGMAVGGLIGAGISGASSLIGATSRVTEQAEVAHGIRELDPTEVRVYSDIERERSIPGAIIGSLHELERELDLAREGIAGRGIWDKFGRSGIDRDMTAEQALRQALHVASQHEVGSWDYHQFVNRFSGLKKMMSAGITPEFLDRRMEGKISMEEFENLRQAQIDIDEAVSEWNEFFDRRKADVVGVAYSGKPTHKELSELEEGDVYHRWIRGENGEKILETLIKIDGNIQAIRDGAEGDM